MQSWSRRSWSPHVGLLQAVLAVLLAVALRPFDWYGSRAAEGNPEPNDDWWQYRCDHERCDQFFWSAEKPIRVPVCHIHERRMKCEHEGY
jgi:hypothetical protein